MQNGMTSNLHIASCLVSFASSKVGLVSIYGNSCVCICYDDCPFFIQFVAFGRFIFLVLVWYIHNAILLMFPFEQ